MSSEKPINVLQIIARLNIGGPAVYAISLIENLSQKQYNSLLVCGKVGPLEGDMSYLATEKGISPFFIPHLGREISILDDRRTFKELRKIIKQFKPDIIHTHTAKAGTLGRLAGIIHNIFKGKNNRIRLVHTFHGHVFHGYFRPSKTLFFIIIERFLALFTDRIIVISSLQQYDICKKYRITGSGRIRIIPLGFDLSPFLRSSQEAGRLLEKFFPGTDEEVFIVGIIGRLTPIKNHRMFLEMMEVLKKRGIINKFRFFIVGDGELREDLVLQSKQLGLQDFVKFTGWQRDMPEVYRAMDTVVLTSINEGTPVTLIEAMAAGIPVVGTDVGGLPDLMGPFEKETEGFKIMRHGLLVPSGRSDIMASAIKYLADNQAFSHNIATRSREFVKDNFSMDRLVKDMEKLYSEMVSG
ncbi:MAG: glycosyltransferase [Deltaproteobacteria bacterium]|nr:glycosyltransferase [Deltaproteobacteria bacterium]